MKNALMSMVKGGMIAVAAAGAVVACAWAEELSWGLALRPGDAAVWRETTAAMAQRGLDFVVVDCDGGDAVATVDARSRWNESVRLAVADLREKGLEAIPLVGDGATDINEALAAFGKPRFVHLGLGRLGEALLRRVGEIERAGARAWVWSEAHGTQLERFFAEVPTRVLQSNRYAGQNFDLVGMWKDYETNPEVAQLDAYGLLDIQDYDQIPAGTCANFTNLVAYSRRNIARKHLKGFLLVPSLATTSANRAELLAAVDLVAQAKRQDANRPQPRALPQRDYAADPAFVRAFHDAMLVKAKQKCFPAKPELGLAAHIGTGGNFGGYFLWDTCFNVLWGMREPKGTFPVLESMDNLYKLADEEGFVNRQYTATGKPSWAGEHPISFAPPLMTWAEWEIYSSGFSGKARLETVYPKLVRHHRASAHRFRRDDGLYFGDWWGCGMDDLPRWPRDLDRAASLATGIPFTTETIRGRKVEKLDWFMEARRPYFCWNRQAGWIDLSCQMALDALSLARIAETIGKEDEAKAWRTEHAALAAAINEKCWSEELGFYCDVGPKGIVPRRHSGGFWVFLSEVATKERAAKVLKTLMDPKLFNRAIPFPTLPADDPDYGPDDPHSYSCGVVWPPTNYSLIKGLRAAGFEKEAAWAARKWFNAHAELFTRYGTVMENMSPEQCGEKRARSQGDFCGWGALVPLALPREFGWLKD